MTTDTTTTPPTAIERPWLDADLPIDERVELLLGEMTVEEKVGLFFQTMIAMAPTARSPTATPPSGSPRPTSTCVSGT